MVVRMCLIPRTAHLKAITVGNFMCGVLKHNKKPFPGDRDWSVWTQPVSPSAEVSDAVVVSLRWADRSSSGIP